MSKSELIDEHVSLQQCKRAVDALLEHAAKHQQKQQETELLPGKEQHVWLQVAVKRMQPEKKLKPFKIPIKYPLVDPRTTPVCLITKDPQREYKDLLESHGIKFINRVVGITKLKGKFKPFEARRLLLQENGLFLADERVVPLLPGLLGKAFFKAKKQPIPVCLTRKDLKGELERAISSTYMHQNQGTCTSVKIGTISQTPAQVLANLKTALPAIVKTLKGEWDNVQSLGIKTNSSVNLPIWSCELGGEEGGRWDGLVAEDSDESDEGAEEGSSEDDAAIEVGEAKVAAKPAQKASEAAKGKKRSAEEPEPEKPKKKVKAAKPVDIDESAPSKKISTPAAASPSSKKAPAVPSQPEEADSSQKKRRKAKKEASTAPAPQSDATPASTAVAPSDEQKKKPKASKKRAAAPEGTPTQTSAASGSEADVESTDPTLSASALRKKEKRKKAKAGEESAGPVVDEAQPAKKRKAKDAQESETARNAPVEGLSKDEMKQKRAANGGEKKKDKVVKGKKGAAKEGVVGKKL